MRLGLDYGGTKIEGIVLGPDGAERARARVPTPRFDYDGGIRAIGGLLERLEAEAGGPHRQRRHRRSRLGRPDDRAHLAGQLDLAARPRPARRPRGRAGAAGEDRQRRQLLRALRGGGRRRQGRRGGVRGDPRHRRRRRRRRARPAGGGASTPSAASGATSRCRRRATTSARVRSAPAASPGTPSPGSPARTSPPTTPAARAFPPPRRRRPGDRRPRRAPATPPPGRRSRRYEDRLGRSLAVIVNVLDPDVIVLGGGLSNVARLYETVPALIAPHVFGDRFPTRLVQNVHGDSSGVRGAAWL